MKTGKSMPRWIVVFLPLLALCTTAFGQVGFGTIAGRVIDPSGALVVGAKVTATNVATNVRTVAASNAAGEYQVLQLIPGTYRLEAEAPGFKTLKQEAIAIHVGDRLTIDLALALGQSLEVVEVQAAAPLLRTQDAQNGEVGNSTFIMNLPQLQRDPLRLLTLAGNVQGSGERAEGGGTQGSGSDTRINGGRTSGVQYLVDGINTDTGVGHGVTSVTPGMESVAEFKVITGGISAEYGRASGGLVQYVTKSGTNGLHGQLFEYLRNDKLNANSWQQNFLGGEKTPFRNNDFGFALGGPVYVPKIYHGKDKTFFFANYEGIRFSQAGTLNTGSVPTQAMRDGDLSGITYDGLHAMLYDPNASDSTLKYVNNPDGSTSILRTVPLADGMHVPKSLWDSTGFTAALQSLVPLPNTPGDAHASFENNFVGPSSTTSRSDVFAVRLDHNINDNQRIFGRFTRQTYTDGSTTWRGLLDSAFGTVHPGAWSQTLHYDWSISPTTIFSANAGGTFTPTTSGGLYSGAGKTAIDSLPLNATARSILGPGELPIIQMNSGGENDIRMAQTGYSSLLNTTAYNASAMLTKILTRHTLKFGFETQRYYDNFISSGAADWPYGGWWRFTSSPVDQMVCDQCNLNAQLAPEVYAAYLMGIMDYDPTSGATNRAEAFNYYAAFVQDDFRVTPKLTVNVGLRWDMETPITERHNRYYFWDPNASASDAGISIAPGFDWNTALTNAGLDPSTVPTPSWVKNGLPKGLIMLPGTPQHPGRTVTAYHPWQFAPRLGVAYQLNSKTVIRASFAQMYMTTMANPSTNAPDAAIALGDAANGGWHSSDPNGVPYAHYIDTVSDPFHPGVAGGYYNKYTRSVAVANQQATGYSTVASGFNYNERMPYELTQSFSVQRELPKGFVVEATYSGNEGRKLISPDSISQFPKDLFVPSNAGVYGTTIQNPFVGIGTTAPVTLSYLMMQYPFYGPVREMGVNLGRSNYQSLNVRLEQRLWHGMTFLINYTFSKLLDNVGGPEADAANSVDTGRGGKAVQSVDSYSTAYGYSPYDEKHRLVGTYSIQLPFGRGRHFLNSPTGMGQLLLDGIVGGWQIAGQGIYRSGRPIVFGYVNTNVNNNYGIEETFGSFVPGTNPLNPAFAGVHKVQVSSSDPRPVGQGVFNTAAFVGPKTFTYGTLPPVYAGVRDPGNGIMDLSVMKNFPLLSRDGSRFLQFRMEAQNAFNHRGTRGYNTDVQSSDFGFITADNTMGLAYFQERRIQVSARIVF